MLNEIFNLKEGRSVPSDLSTLPHFKRIRTDYMMYNNKLGYGDESSEMLRCAALVAIYRNYTLPQKLRQNFPVNVGKLTRHSTASRPVFSATATEFVQYNILGANILREIQNLDFNSHSAAT